VPSLYEGSFVINDLIRIHHQDYRDDLDFWISRTNNQDPVLELGCGFGRVLLPLIRSGRQVVGVDLDIEYLKLLQSSSGIQDVFILQADMIQLPLNTAFGAIIVPCNTYSCLNRLDRMKLLIEIKRILAENGSFIVSMPNPLHIQQVHQEMGVVAGIPPGEIEGSIAHPRTGFPVQISSKLDPLPDKLRWVWIYDHLLPDGSVERSSQAVDHYLSSPEQYLLEFEKAGLVVVDFWGDFDCRPYQEDSAFLILSASPA
jgi:SAM-dependent methyltransferase